MHTTLGHDPPAFAVPAIRAAEGGVFEWDVQADRLCCCRNAARLHGLSEAEAQAGVPLARIVALVHPQDRAAFLDEIAEQIGHRDLVVLEYRAVPGSDRVRRLLMRGRFEVDANGVTVAGRGIMLDLTADASGLPRTPLERAADRAIATRRAIDEIVEPERRSLRQRIDALLLEIGCALARRNA